MSEIHDNLALINYGLRELDRIGQPHEFTFSGRPSYEIYSLDPLATSGNYGRHRNRGPVIIGTVALKQILFAPTRYPDRVVMHAAFQTGDRMFGNPLNFNKLGPREMMYEVFENLGLKDWEIT
jgi:hypothetical protein